MPDGEAQDAASAYVAALVVAVAGALYAWPLVDGTTADGVLLLDGLVTSGAAALVAAAALWALADAASRARWAWAAAAIGATVLAFLQAAKAGAAPALSEATVEVAAAGAVALAVGGWAALVLLDARRTAWEAPRRRVELLLAVVSTGLVVWTLHRAAGVDPSPRVAVVAAAVSVLIGTAVLSLARSHGQPLRRALLPAGLLLYGLAEAMRPVVDDATGPVIRIVGWCAASGLAVVALAAVGSRRTTPGTETPAPRSTSNGLSVAAVVGLVVITLLAVRPPDATQTILGLAVVGLLLTRLVLLHHELRTTMQTLAAEESALRHVAFHDQLTGLANRELFFNRLDQALEGHRRRGGSVAVLFCDLDDFKRINDNHGHAIGDQVLRIVAQRLRAALRPTDTLARLGGDEFAVLLEPDADPAPVVARMLDQLRDAVPVDALELQVGMSVGVAVVGPDDVTPTGGIVLSRADQAMYHDKRADGRLQVRAQEGSPAGTDRALVAPEDEVLFAPEDEALRLAWVEDLEAGRFDIVYQPLVDPSTGAVHGMEAFTRWSAKGVRIPPQTFVRLTEEAGLGAQLTAGVLDRAARQVQVWSRALHHHRLTVAVKLTSGELLDPGLPERVTAVIDRHGLQPGQLVLEVSAAALGGDPASAAPVVRRLREAGAGLSVSGLIEDPVAFIHLEVLPLHAIKVQSRRAAAPDPEGVERLLRVLKGIGHELDVKVVVEQVERADQLSLVQRVGGLLAQGYHVARPAPADAMTGALQSGVPLPS